MSDLYPRLHRALNPRVVAVVGDKKATGYNWLKNMQPFTGKLYSVQIDPNEIPGIEAMGVPNYQSLMDIPDEIDYVICAVPRQVTPRVMRDAVAKRVGGVGMYTSGFAETGEELGKQLQEAVVGIAREHDMLLIGPNCMGLYNPELGVRFSAEQMAGVHGNVGAISQSGTHGTNISVLAAANGIYLTRCVSIGNAVVIDVPDYIEYFGRNPETEVIAMYMEGARDGRRFASVLRDVARRKPVVIWKGGQTEAGARATMSHTASLAAPANVWNALIRQSGAIAVDSLDELVDTLQVLQFNKPWTGVRLALMAMTGGQSVVLTDAFAKQGFDAPELEESSYEQLGSFFNIIGGSYRNPFDMAGTINQDPEYLDRLFQIVDADPNVDAIAMEMSPLWIRRWVNNPAMFDDLLDRIKRHQERSAMPFVAILHPAHLEAEVASLRPKIQERGIAVLPSFDRAARAMARVVAYHRRRAEESTAG
ncbi:MAG: CoA-binding protein [Dehalococcoidia bacterium]